MSLKKQKRFDQINVIPFIDIMLVLLVMVLTTATFVKQGIIPVDLPDAAASEKKQDELKEVNLYVTKDGKLFMDKKEMDAAALEKALSTISKKQTVVLRSDKEATFQDFVTVMDILKKLEHEQLYIVTKE